jgi:iron only hydrogenase large subunit-like protein
MIAHAIHIKKKLGDDAKVVFIGPCVAKKAEAERPENRGLVDCVLTFAELHEWLEKASISLSACEESRFDEEPQGDARYFPLVGGSVKTAALDTDLLAAGVVSASGFSEICELLASLGPGGSPRVIEPLFCSQGCVNGPAVSVTTNVYERRKDVIDYAGLHEGKRPAADQQYSELITKYRPIVGADEELSEVTEAQIQEVYDKTGKSDPANQLNWRLWLSVLQGEGHRRHQRHG